MRPLQAGSLAKQYPVLAGFASLTSHASMRLCSTCLGKRKGCGRERRTCVQSYTSAICRGTCYACWDAQYGFTDWTTDTWTRAGAGNPSLHKKHDLVSDWETITPHYAVAFSRFRLRHRTGRKARGDAGDTRQSPRWPAVARQSIGPLARPEGLPSLWMKKCGGAAATCAPHDP